MFLFSYNYKTKVQENRILRLQKSNEMKFAKYFLSAIAISAVFFSCSKDDDNDIIVVPPRDRAEQQVVDDELLQNYLKTHFYTLKDVDLNDDGIIEYRVPLFDTIAGNNINEVSIWDSGQVETKVVNREDVDYTIYLLSFNRGAGIDGKKSSPTSVDSTYVTYRGEFLYDNVDADGDGIPDDVDVDADGDGNADTIDDDSVKVDTDGDGIIDEADVDSPANAGKDDTDGDGIIDEKDSVDNSDLDRKVFDSAATPTWFDLISILEGIRTTIIDYKVSSGVSSIAGDGTINYNNDFGEYTVFMPSGLGYFSDVVSGIPQYSPLIFTLQLYQFNESDHDRDGIPSYLEDLDEDGLVIDSDDDSDNDGFSNFIDSDDDGDGTPTKDEITVLGDLDNNGSISLDEITFYDDDGDGVPNHLDPDDEEFKND